MRVSVYHQMIAAAAVRELGADPNDVESVEIDDVAVSDLQKAHRQLEKRESADGNWVTNGLDGAIAKIADKLSPKDDATQSEDEKKALRLMKPAGRLRQRAVDMKSAYRTSKTGVKVAAMKKRFDQTKAGQAMNTLVLQGDPERVEYQGTARVRLKDGTVRPVDVTVLDRKRTLVLQRLALSAGVLGSILGPVPIPLIDNLVPALLGAATLIGAGVAQAAGNAQFGTALRKTSAKHFLLSVFGFSPVRLRVLLNDAKDIKGLREPQE